MYDIAIVGLGPAGATLARLIDPTRRVIAIDKKALDADEGFRKPCGGLLADDAQISLSRFCLTLPKDILVDPQIFAVRTIDTAQNLTRHYPRFYMNMDRGKFDRWLMQLIPDRVTIADRAVVSAIERRNGAFAITYKRHGESVTVEAKTIVGADGAHSTVRRKLFPDFRLKTLLSIQEHYADQNARPLYSCFFDASLTDSYAWGISKDGVFVFGGAFPHKDARKRFEALRDKLTAYGYQFGDPIRTEACLVVAHDGRCCLGRHNAVLIGEAAGLISPSSLEGISYAFDSAQILAEILNTGVADPAAHYKRRMWKLRAKLLTKVAKSFFLTRPFTRRVLMQSGLQSIDILGDIHPPNPRPKGH